MKNQIPFNLLKTSILFFVSLTCIPVFAQQADTTYYNKYGMKSDADSAYYYRVREQRGEKQHVREHFASNQQIHWEGLEIKRPGRNKRDGLWKHFYENGNPKIEATYDNGARIGTSKEWFENGQQEAIWNHEAGNTTLQSSWASDGTAMVVDGEGVYEDHYTGGEKHYRGTIKAGKQQGEWQAWFVDGQLMHKLQIDKGFIVGTEEIWANNGQKIYEGIHGERLERTYWDTEGTNTHAVITGAKQSPTNWFGLGDVDPLPLNMSEVRMAIGYPKKAQKKDIEGRVQVMIIVDEEGEVLLATVVKPVNEIFEKAIMKHIYGLQLTPGIVSGRFVKVRVNVPFYFKLTD